MIFDLFDEDTFRVNLEFKLKMKAASKQAICGRGVERNCFHVW